MSKIIILHALMASCAICFFILQTMMVVYMDDTVNQIRLASAYAPVTFGLIASYLWGWDRLSAKWTVFSCAVTFSSACMYLFVHFYAIAGITGNFRSILIGLTSVVTAAFGFSFAAGRAKTTARRAIATVD